MDTGFNEIKSTGEVSKKESTYCLEAWAVAFPTQRKVIGAVNDVRPRQHTERNEEKATKHDILCKSHTTEHIKDISSEFSLQVLHLEQKNNPFITAPSYYPYDHLVSGQHC